MIKVLVIGIGNPVPSFIQRRLHALAERGINLVVSLEYGQTNLLHPCIGIVRYGDVWNMSLIDVFRYLVKLLGKPHIFYWLWRLNTISGAIARLKTTIKYFPLAVVPNISLIHFQWLTSIEGVNWFKFIYRVPIVSSVRGSQVTVYPHTRPGFSEIVKQSIKLADVLHLVSKDLQKPCINFGAKPDQIIVNYNGIDLNRFTPAQQSTSIATLKLISTGGLIWRKGYLFQLEIVRKLKPIVNVSLTIVGNGPDMEGLRYMAYRLGIKDLVIFKGKLGEDEVLSLLRESDIYVSTSAAEGLSNSCMEAAACGLPIVAFDCEGIRELVESGTTGFILAYGDVDGCVDAIRSLTDIQKRKEMGHHARMKIETEFDERTWVEKMILIYQHIGQSGSHE